MNFLTKTNRENKLMIRKEGDIRYGVFLPKKLKLKNISIVNIYYSIYDANYYTLILIF